MARGRYMVIEIECGRDNLRQPDLRQGSILSGEWEEMGDVEAAIAEANVLSNKYPDRTFLVLEMVAVADAMSRRRH